MNSGLALTFILHPGTFSMYPQKIVALEIHFSSHLRIPTFMIQERSATLILVVHGGLAGMADVIKEQGGAIELLRLEKEGYDIKRGSERSESQTKRGKLVD